MMKQLGRFCILMSLVTNACFLFACTQGGSSYPVPDGNTNASSTTNSSNAAPPAPYYGVVDRRDCETIGGWVMNTTDPKADIKVELYVEGKLVETLSARNLRPDLANKMGTGHYGFSFKIPSAYKDDRPYLATVKVAGSEYTVPLFEGVFSTFQCKP